MTGSEDDLEVVRGSGNIFRDLGESDADVKQAKAILAARSSTFWMTGSYPLAKPEPFSEIDQSEFARIRNANLGRFTIDRLMRIVNRLDPHVRMVVSEASEPKAARRVAQAPLSRRGRGRNQRAGVCRVICSRIAATTGKGEQIDVSAEDDRPPQRAWRARRRRLAPLALAGSSRAARAAAPMLGAARPTYYRFQLGGFEVTTLLDGAIPLEGPHPIFGQDQSAGGGAGSWPRPTSCRRPGWRSSSRRWW